MANCNGVGPHGIRSLVKVVFLSVHVDWDGGIMGGSIGGGFMVKNWVECW